MAAVEAINGSSALLTKSDCRLQHVIWFSYDLLRLAVGVGTRMQSS